MTGNEISFFFNINGMGGYTRKVGGDRAGGTVQPFNIDSEVSF